MRACPNLVLSRSSIFFDHTGKVLRPITGDALAVLVGEPLEIVRQHVLRGSDAYCPHRQFSSACLPFRSLLSDQFAVKPTRCRSHQIEARWRTFTFGITRELIHTPPVSRQQMTLDRLAAWKLLENGSG